MIRRRGMLGRMAKQNSLGRILKNICVQQLKYIIYFFITKGGLYLSRTFQVFFCLPMDKNIPKR